MGIPVAKAVLTFVQAQPAVVMPLFVRARLDTAVWAPAHRGRNMELLAHHYYYSTAYLFTNNLSSLRQ